MVNDKNENTFVLEKVGVVYCWVLLKVWILFWLLGKLWDNGVI
jgi:hypothetical protein